MSFPNNWRYNRVRNVYFISENMRYYLCGDKCDEWQVLCMCALDVCRALSPASGLRAIRLLNT